MLITGLFVGDDPVEKTNRGMLGLVHGGGFRLLGVQTLACVCIIAWASAVTFIQLFVSVKTRDRWNRWVPCGKNMFCNQKSFFSVPQCCGKKGKGKLTHVVFQILSFLPPSAQQLHNGKKHFNYMKTMQCPVFGQRTDQPGEWFHSHFLWTQDDSWSNDCKQKQLAQRKPVICQIDYFRSLRRQ